MSNVSPQDRLTKLATHRLGVAVFTAALLAACAPASAGTTSGQHASSSKAAAAPAAPPAAPISASPDTTASTDSGLFPADDLALNGTARFGAIAIPHHPDPLRIERYVWRPNLKDLAAIPASAPVWKVDTTAMPAPETVAARLGVSGSPTEERFSSVAGYAWPNGVLSYTPATSGYEWTVVLARPSDKSAVANSRAFLIDHGLLRQDARNDVETQTFPTGGLRVTFHRRLGNLRVYGAGTMLEFGADGNAVVLGTNRPMAGGSTYRLRSAATAWAAAISQGWYADDGIMHGDPGIVQLQRFTADTVEVGYWEADASQVLQYLLPMYCFTDSQQHIRLFTPAVSSEYL